VFLSIRGVVLALPLFSPHQEQQAAFPALQWAFKQMSQAVKMAF
jgi:hypothetical protein